MNLSLQILLLLVQTGACQISTLEDQNGRQVRAFVCYPLPVSPPEEDKPDETPKVDKSKPHT